jgi:hypothetical protein
MRYVRKWRLLEIGEMVEQRRVELLASALRKGLSAKT